MSNAIVPDRGKKDVLPPGALDARNQAVLGRVRRMADLLDARFRMPGTNIRFGIDGIIGLVPGIGDAVTTAIAAYLFVEAIGAGVRKRTILRMAFNTGADTVIGAVPLLGDIFDIGFKSNLRNADLIQADLERMARAQADQSNIR